MMRLQELVHGGHLPESWSNSKLRAVFKVRKGYKNLASAQRNLLSLSYGRIVPKDIETAGGLLPASFDTYQIVLPGNIVMRLTDLQNDKRSLRQGLVSEKGIITSAYDALAITAPNEPRFWFYTLLALDLAKYYYSLGGGVRQSISFRDFPNEWIGVPPIKDQRQIADFLDDETSRIDQLIDKKQSLIETLRESHAALLDSLTWGAEQASAWRKIPFKWICKIPNGQVDPEAEPWVDLPLIAPNHIESRTGRLLAIETAREQAAISGKYTYPAGTVLYSKIRPALAKACIAPTAGLCSADMYPIIPSAKLRAEYLLVQLLSRKFTDWATLESMRVAMPKINRETLGSIRLCVPDVDTQDSLIEIWRKHQRTHEACQQLLFSSAQKLSEMRSSLVIAAVTGQINMSAWRQQGGTERQLDKVEAEATV